MFQSGLVTYTKERSLDIIRTVKEKSIADGIEVMKKQDHSGLSWSLMKTMIKDFCDCGDEFLAQLDE